MHRLEECVAKGLAYTTGSDRRIFPVGFHHRTSDRSRDLHSDCLQYLSRTQLRIGR